MMLGRRIVQGHWIDGSNRRIQVEKRKHLSTLDFGKWTPDFQQDHEPQRFQDVLRVVRFDDEEYRRQHRSDDKLEPIRECFTFGSTICGMVIFLDLC